MKFTGRLLPGLILLSLLTVSARGDLTFFSASHLLFAGDSLGAGASPVAPGPESPDADADAPGMYPGDRPSEATTGPDSLLSSAESATQEPGDEEGPLSTYESHTRHPRSILHAGATGDSPRGSFWTDKFQTWRDYRHTDYATYSAKIKLAHGTGLVFSASLDPAHRSLSDRDSGSTLFAGRALVAVLSLSVPLP